ncbi:imidazolonepropionase [Tepiditoga spiralis]|uniref:Imidazolonepropionase n=1 Tax=Tepiditoga spiralis TaxID=2108365 RepID=A0A7G1G4T8_9BACT|nr:imidazolonepropionase [Tepiditoga spiralis]BBE30246.1 imidazolonepropionase [Tepiditoga spiralis]
MKLLIKNAAEIVTCSGYSSKKGKEMNDIKVIKNGTIVIENGIITDIGTNIKVDEKEYKVIDATGKSVLPGFVDSHTHFVFGGYREEEFDWRLKGQTYMEIMEKGGGIASSVKHTRNTTEEELVNLGKKRLDSMMNFGVTTVEGKSGYGLNLETELKQLRVMKKLNEIHSIDVIPTFLGAHSIPKEYKGKSDEYVEKLIKEMLPKVKEENLAKFCDVFCEKNVFTVEQSKKILLEAQKYGLKSKIHADEIVELGGAKLAAEINAVSADHLLQTSDAGIEKLANSSTIATLLPLTAFSLKENFANARKMIDSGCSVALATDMNPGSCFSNSIPLLISLATIYMNMTIEETITALTINGAAALGLEKEIGSIDKGKKADIIILEYPSYKFLPYHTGVNIIETVIKDGIVRRDKSV